MKVDRKPVGKIRFYSMFLGKLSTHSAFGRPVKTIALYS